MKIAKKFRFFRPSPDSIKDVHVDWYKKDTKSAICEGYKLGADMIVNAALIEHHHTDIFLWPAAFLYRHYIELQLKNILRMSLGTPLEVRCDRALADHDLADLWLNARKVLRNAWPNSDESELSPVEDAIKEFNLVDKRGDAFRYYENKAGKKHLSDLPRQVCLEYLMQEMDAVFDILNGCEIGIREIIEFVPD
jgi:hypothetical protein